MLLRAILAFAVGLAVGLLATLLHRGTIAGAAPAMAFAQEQMPQITLDEVQLKSVPFSQAIQYLAAKAKLNIVADYRQLEACGVDRATPVSIDLHHVLLDAALDQLLKQVDGATKLEGKMSKGVLTISSADALESQIVRVYGVKDLVDQEASPARLEEIIEAVVSDGVFDGPRTDAEIWGGRILVVLTTADRQAKVVDLLEHMRHLDPLPPERH